jgi:hypothetical protein
LPFRQGREDGAPLLFLRLALLLVLLAVRLLPCSSAILPPFLLLVLVLVLVLLLVVAVAVAMTVPHRFLLLHRRTN